MTDFMTKSALQDLALLRFDHDRHNRDTKPLSKVSKYRNYCRKHVGGEGPPTKAAPMTVTHCQQLINKRKKIHSQYYLPHHKTQYLIMIENTIQVQHIIQQ